MERYRAQDGPERVRVWAGPGWVNVEPVGADAALVVGEVEYVRADIHQGAVEALRDVDSLLRGFRTMNALDAPLADLDGARERIRVVLEEVGNA